MNKRGNRWLFWGIPYIVIVLLDKCPFTLILNDLLDKLEENHDSNGHNTKVFKF